jgi:hypothetical protein
MNKKQIGCCGAYCGTCPVIKENLCRGCKIGYQTGERDLSKAKCKIKICCLRKRFSSCADCDDYDTCEILQGFYAKNGYKYKKYNEALNFIRSSGYEKFLDIADSWTQQYGKL